MPPNAGVVSGRGGTDYAGPNETSTLTLSDLAALDYTLMIDVIKQTETCTAGLVEAKL